MAVVSRVSGRACRPSRYSSRIARIVAMASCSRGPRERRSFGVRYAVFAAPARRRRRSRRGRSAWDRVTIPDLPVPDGTTRLRNGRGGRPCARIRPASEGGVVPGRGFPQGTDPCEPAVGDGAHGSRRPGAAKPQGRVLGPAGRARRSHACCCDAIGVSIATRVDAFESAIVRCADVCGPVVARI